MGSAGGYAGEILRVDLSTGEMNRIPTDLYADRFLGGRGIAAKIYWDEVPPQADAFHPDNRLIFATGPVSAATNFLGSRWQVCGKSPIHDRFSYCNLGGAWGAALKLAGYDALVVRGKAERPVYLWIRQGEAQIRDASHLMGKGAIACREQLKAELGETFKVVAIGPAGENQVTFSVLMADGDASGSSGLASVMGSKQLKAIAVHGKKRPMVAYPERIQGIMRKVQGLTTEMDMRFLLSAVPHLKLVPAERLKKEVCFGCSGRCIRTSYVDEEGRRGKFTCGSSYFYLMRARSYYGESNEVPFRATKLMDDHGLDSYGLEATIMWLARCYKAGVLTEKQTGIPLSKIGSLEFIEALIRKISFREGFGDLLAHGVRRAAEALGPEAQAMVTDYVSKTNYMPVYGPRMYITTGLLHAMEPRLPIQQLHEVATLALRWVMNQRPSPGSPGVDSTVFRAIAKRFWGSELAADFSTYEGKALAAAKIQDRQYAKECMILCDFVWPIMYSEATQDRVGDPSLESSICSAVTGRELDEEGLYRIGERVFNLQRAILAREGHTGRVHDSLEEFEYEVPLRGDVGNPECVVPGRDGEVFSRKGMVVDREAFESLKDEYYGIRGWDVATGLQKMATLEQLGLEEVGKTLRGEGLLGG